MVVQFATAVSVQRMDDTFTGYGAKIDTSAKTITLTRALPTRPLARVSRRRPGS
jgi:hypothetical protein